VWYRLLTHRYRGDTFVILSRARGWWVVQRDPTGSGIVETDIVKQGWVPAGCLLETNVPVASAIAEATAAKGASATGSPPSSPVSKTPILPLSIISTSFPGIALMDYKKKGDEELDLVKDDALRVFKRYNHWSYVRSSSSLPKSFLITLLAGCERRGRGSWLGTSKFCLFILYVSYDIILHLSRGSLARLPLLGMYRQHPAPVYHLTSIPGQMTPINRRYHQCPLPSLREPRQP
jgi:hypothetical protein